MERHPLPLRLLLLRLLLSPAVSSSPSPRLLARADTCAAKGLDSCPDHFPDDFCCPKSTSCLSLAADTTVLCCPKGNSCNIIKPITCDIQSQNATSNLIAVVKTTVFDVALKKCGSYCCPFGYSCAPNGNGCSKDKDQSRPPKTRQPAAGRTSTEADSTPSASTPSASAPSASNPSASTPSASSAPSDGSDASDASAPSKAPLIGGIVGGAAGLVFIIVIVVLCIRRNRMSASDQDSLRDSGATATSAPYGHIISAPVLHPGSYRSDFLRGNPASPEPSHAPAAGPSYSPSNTHLRPTPRISIPNPFDSPSPSPSPSPYSPLESRASVSSVQELTARTGHVVGSRLAPIRTMKPSEARHSGRMSRGDFQQQPASENISVFADPDTVRRGHHDDRRVTTMSDMMDEVGLGDVHRGRRPYVPGATPRI